MTTASLIIAALAFLATAAAYGDVLRRVAQTHKEFHAGADDAAAAVHALAEQVREMGSDRSQPDEPTSWIDERTHRRVLLHTTDESSFEGILVTVDADAIVLADAKSLDGEMPIELAGEQWFTRDQVKFLQVIAP